MNGFYGNKAQRRHNVTQRRSMRSVRDFQNLKKMEGEAFWKLAAAAQVHIKEKKLLPVCSSLNILATLPVPAVRPVGAQHSLRLQTE